MAGAFAGECGAGILLTVGDMALSGFCDLLAGYTATHTWNRGAPRRRDRRFTVDAAEGRGRCGNRPGVCDLFL